MSEVPAASFSFLLSMEHALSAEVVKDFLAVSAFVATALRAQKLLGAVGVKHHMYWYQLRQITCWFSWLNEVDAAQDRSLVHAW